MSEADEKADEKLDEKESAARIIYHIDGDFIQGNKTSVGDITDSEGIAVGTDASVAVEKGAVPAQAAGTHAITAIERQTARPVEYICYLSKDRLASLYDQVDAATLADPRNWQRTTTLLPLGDAAEPTGRERSRRSSVSQLAVVLDYLEKNEKIGDLAQIVQNRGQLNRDWYSVDTGFRSGSWEPATPVIHLTGRIGDYQLDLSCAKANFTGLHQEGDIYIPTSTNDILFSGRAELKLRGLVRLAAKDQEEKILRGTALYLVLNPDLGSL